MRPRDAELRRIGGGELDDGLAQVVVCHAKVVQYLGGETVADSQAAQGKVAGSDVLVSEATDSRRACSGTAVPLGLMGILPVRGSPLGTPMPR